MGFDLAQVLSDDKHYSPFICGICKHLVSMDAVVTKCSHPFCRQCLESHAMNVASQGDICLCPTCTVDISASKALPEQRLGATCAAAEPLQHAQPLAFQVLSLVQVACIDRTNTLHCEWSGDYSSFVEHCVATHGENTVFQAFLSSPRTLTLCPPISPVRSPSNRPPRSGDARPTLKGHRSMSMPSLVGVDPSPPEQIPNDDTGRSFPDSPIRTPGYLKRSLSMEDVLQDSPKLAIGELLEGSPRQANASIASSPEACKTELDAKDAPPAKVERTFSDDLSLARSVDLTYRNKPPPKPEKKKNRKPSLTHENDNELEVSYSHALDWNMSINSLNGWNNSFVEPIPMETLAEDDDETLYALEFEPEKDGNVPAESAKKTRDKAEKLKKQANAKFNKGDFAAARTLYTEGIMTMSTLDSIRDADSELLSNMHSNRAVTFFREKRFENCITDCDKAIGFDPLYDKSWIRKWRALMALGNFDEAYTCLETAGKNMPESKRVQEALTKSKLDKQLLTDARTMVDKGDFQKARDILKPYSRTSDNLGLLFVAAKADAGLGLTESALEKVNKALRFNPTHTVGLELRGYTLYLAGETEKGAHLLQEAYDRNRDNKNVRGDLMRCQKTHSAVTKGRSCVKRGRYVEAVEHFSIAIKESGTVPLKAPLYGTLRTERAEAFLLSKNYMQAMKDCDDVLNAQKENATTWSVRADIMIALGKPDEAKSELKKIKHSWGADNPTIDEAYRRVDFELRVLKADDELMRFVKDLESGKAEKLFSDPKRKSSRRRDFEKEDRNEKERRPSRSERERTPGTSERYNGRRPKSSERRARSRSRVRSREQKGFPDFDKSPGKGERKKALPPRAVDDIAFNPRRMSKDGKHTRPRLERAAASERGIGKSHRSRSAKRT